MTNKKKFCYERLAAVALVVQPIAFVHVSICMYQCTKAIGLIALPHAIVDVPVGEDKYAIAVLFIVLELASVGIPARDSDRAVPVHLVLPPVALVVRAASSLVSRRVCVVASKDVIVTPTAMATVLDTAATAASMPLMTP